MITPVINFSFNSLDLYAISKSVKIDLDYVFKSDKNIFRPEKIRALCRVTLVWAAINKIIRGVECNSSKQRAIFEDTFIDTQKEIFTNRNIFAVGLFCALTTRKAVPLKVCSSIIKAADCCFQNLILHQVERNPVSSMSLNEKKLPLAKKIILDPHIHISRCFQRLAIIFLIRFLIIRIIILFLILFFEIIHSEAQLLVSWLPLDKSGL